MGYGALAGLGVGAALAFILIIALTTFISRFRGQGAKKSKSSELDTLEVGEEKNPDQDAAIWIPELYHENIPWSPEEFGGTALSRFELNGSVGRWKWITINPT